jgi:hypothetical protein
MADAECRRGLESEPSVVPGIAFDDDEWLAALVSAENGSANE